MICAGKDSVKPMNESDSPRRLLDVALAFAHAALNEPTDRRVTQARLRAEEVLPRIRSLNPSGLPLTEATEVISMVKQLRAVLSLIDRSFEERRAP